MSSHAPARFVRLNETYRAAVNFIIDGRPASALQGDTLLTVIMCAVLNSAARSAPVFA